MLIPPCISKDVFDHIKDFVTNKVRLGKVIDTATGGSEPIPIYSPRDGIINMQYTLNNLSSPNIDLLNFIITTLQDVSRFPQWMLLPKKSYFNQSYESIIK